ncbi:MAG: hypothetical protein MJZ29_09310, partial [Bacteroidaceae bacterium]|nr:hypothetical protein [Bacteroidaceae bacterium]
YNINVRNMKKLSWKDDFFEKKCFLSQFIYRTKNACNSPPLRKPLVTPLSTGVCVCGEFLQLSATLLQLSASKIYHFQIIIMPISYRNCGTFASKNAFFDMKLIEFWDKMHIHTYRVR